MAASKLKRNLRRRIKIVSTFDLVEVLPDGRELQRCRTCGYEDKVSWGKGASKVLIEKFARYRAERGMRGVCPQCSRIEALRRYPD